jgi:hypothetical protein
MALVARIGRNFMLNSSLKKIEVFTYTVLIDTYCPELRSECGCLRLDCERCLVSPQFLLLPAVCLPSVRVEND